MPELPEVETMRRGICPAVGATVIAASSLKCACRPILLRPGIRALHRRTLGRQITAIDRLGKRVVVRLDSSDALVFEPRMTGLILISDPPDTTHLRFRLDLEGRTIRHVWFWDRRGLGSVQLLNQAELRERLGQDTLGPDALALDADGLRFRLGTSRREIKVALLDQKAIAGIGNLYASEILHMANIHPQRRCDQLRPDDWQRLHTAMIDVLHDAILHEGSTLSDGTYRNALNRSGGYQHHHRVYAQEGALCRTCGHGTIQRFVQAQRSTFFCPGCQPEPRQRRSRVG